MIDDPDDRRRAPDAARQGPRLPDRRRSSSAAPASARPTAPAAAASSCARARTSRSCAAARRRSSSRELPYGVKKGGDDGVIEKIAELVKDKVAHRDLRRRRPLRQDRHADPDRAEARRDPAGRRSTSSSSTRRCRRRSATTPSRSSTACRGRSPLLELLRHYLDYQREVVTRRSKYELRKAEAARARPRGLPDRARQPRRGDRADPRARPTRTRRARA